MLRSMAHVLVSVSDVGQHLARLHRFFLPVPHIMPPKRKKRGNPTQHIVEIVVPPLSSFASWKDVVHRSSKRPTPQSSLASLTEGSRQFADSNTSKVRGLIN